MPMQKFQPLAPTFSPSLCKAGFSPSRIARFSRTATFPGMVLMLFFIGCPGAGVDDGGGSIDDAGADGGTLPSDAGVESMDAGVVEGTLSTAAASYWQQTVGDRVGQVLVLALQSRLRATHQRIRYDDVDEAFATTDSDRAGCGNIFDFYSARCWAPNEQCGNYTQEGDCFNREHSWPKSWWGGAEGLDAFSDLFHVLPADGFVNNARGNFPLGEVASANYTSSNASLVGPCVQNQANGNCFEPTANLKGDLARGYFYMAVRYEGELDCCDIVAVDGADLKPWTETLLRAWHDADPVDDAERARNNAVFSLQGNRNPFIDAPWWVSRIADF